MVFEGLDPLLLGVALGLDGLCDEFGRKAADWWHSRLVKRHRVKVPSREDS